MLAAGGMAALGIPVSTTHVISSSIMGVGATDELSALGGGDCMKNSRGMAPYDTSRCICRRRDIPDNECYSIIFPDSTLSDKNETMIY